MTHTLHLLVYYVDSEGVCVPGKVFSVGSGSSLAYSVLDTALPGLISDASTDLSHAIDVAVTAVSQATYRDSFSGGFINVLRVNSTGIHHLRRADARTFQSQ